MKMKEQSECVCRDFQHDERWIGRHCLVSPHNNRLVGNTDSLVTDTEAVGGQIPSPHRTVCYRLINPS